MIQRQMTPTHFMYPALVLVLFGLSQSNSADLEPVSAPENEIIGISSPSEEEFDFSKRLYNNLGSGKRTMYSQYKRLPVYNFGLGKRESNRMYSFGLGKRAAGMDRMYSFGLGKRSDGEENNMGKRPISSDRLYSFGIGKRAAADRMYSFGIGKRDYDDYLENDESNLDEDLYEVDPDYVASPLEKRGVNGNGRQLYAFGLGKRLRPYAFGLGKRVPLYSFGIGKRAGNRMYGFGIGKRDIIDQVDLPSREKRLSSSQQQGHRFNFGLGKRDTSEQLDTASTEASAP